MNDSIALLVLAEALTKAAQWATSAHSNRYRELARQACRGNLHTALGEAFSYLEDLIESGDIDEQAIYDALDKANEAAGKRDFETLPSFEE